MKAVILLALLSVVLVDAKPKSSDTVLSYLDTKLLHQYSNEQARPPTFADIISHEPVLGEDSEVMYDQNEEEESIVEYICFENGEYPSSEEFSFELEWTSFELNEDGEVGVEVFQHVKRDKKNLSREIEFSAEYPSFEEEDFGYEAEWAYLNFEGMEDFEGTEAELPFSDDSDETDDVTKMIGNKSHDGKEPRNPHVDLQGDKQNGTEQDNQVGGYFRFPRN